MEVRGLFTTDTGSEVIYYPTQVCMDLLSVVDPVEGMTSKYSRESVCVWCVCVGVCGCGVCV